MDENELLLSDFGPISLDACDDRCPDVAQILSHLDAEATTAAISSLFLYPDIASASLKLEYLLHLSVRHCGGKVEPSAEDIQRAFSALDGLKLAQPPSTNLFTTPVHNSTGSFRIIQGSRENAGFHLQRVLNVLAAMDDGHDLQGLVAMTTRLLTVIDAVVRKAGLDAHAPFSPERIERLPDDILDRVLRKPHLTDLSDAELKKLDLGPDSLAPFLFPIEARRQLDQSGDLDVGSSNPERRPLLRYSGGLRTLLPTSIAHAITVFVAEQLFARNLICAFEECFAKETLSTLAETHLYRNLVSSYAQLHRHPQYFTGNFAFSVDYHRCVITHLIIDGLAGFDVDGLAGINPGWHSIGGSLWRETMALVDMAQSRGVREGLIVVIVSTIGRALPIAHSSEIPDRWSVEYIELGDLVTLARMRFMDWAELFKLVTLRTEIAQGGVEFLNVDGLLSWASAVSTLGDDVLGQAPGPRPKHRQPLRLMVNHVPMLLEIRKVLAWQFYECRVVDPSGQQRLVQSLPGSFWLSSARPPMTSSQDRREGILKCVQLCARPWWLRCVTSPSTDTPLLFQYWEMLCTWLHRIAPLIDSRYLEHCAVSPIEYVFEFEDLSTDAIPARKVPLEEELRDLITVASDREQGLVHVKVHRDFQIAIHSPQNIGERLLTEAMIRGAAYVSGSMSESDILTLTAEICANPDARMIHGFAREGFRDIPPPSRRSPLVISKVDGVLARIGLGWKVDETGEHYEIRGAEPCTMFLNACVQACIESLKTDLRRFKRGPFVRTVLLNYESAAFARQHWTRTGRAQIALADNPDEATRAIRDRLSELAAVSLSCRILIEAAVCECALDGGEILTNIDLASLMSRASLAFHMGGVSDAIHWQAVEPYVGITPLGDVQTRTAFHNTVYDPFGRVSTDDQVQQVFDRYEEFFEVKERNQPAALSAGPFVDALTHELGLSPLELGKVINAVNDMLEDRSEGLRLFLRSELLTLVMRSTDAPEDRASLFIRQFSLFPRTAWWEPMSGFSNKDWQPWRFGRRLSVLRRPLIQLDEAQDARYLVCPGLLREAAIFTVSQFQHGEIPSSQAQSKDMKAWLGHANHHNRLGFNKQVAERLAELGWEAQMEVKLTKILRRQLDKNYGDVDVLAWSEKSGRVLVIECKDLQFKKTLGEVSEQLADYKGRYRRDGKGDDLKKHLDRVEVLAANAESVAAYLKLGSDLKIESHLVFKHPVPMLFALKEVEHMVHVSVFDDLEKLSL